MKDTAEPNLLKMILMAVGLWVSNSSAISDACDMAHAHTRGTGQLRMLSTHRKGIENAGNYARVSRVVCGRLSYNLTVALMHSCGATCFSFRSNDFQPVEILLDRPRRQEPQLQLTHLRSC